MRDVRRKRRTVTEHGPDPVDVHVGSRVHLRRTLLGMSLMKLGDALAITYQQIQKNESGFNRIGSSRLYQLSRILDVPVEYFSEGLEGRTSAWSPDDVMVKTETMELVRASYRILDPKVREALHAMARAMAKGAGSRWAHETASAHAPEYPSGRFCESGGLSRGLRRARECPLLGGGC